MLFPFQLRPVISVLFSSKFSILFPLNRFFMGFRSNFNVSGLNVSVCGENNCVLLVGKNAREITSMEPEAKHNNKTHDDVNVCYVQVRKRS